MPIEPPSWATADEVQYYGRAFLACVFRSRDHFDHYLKTNSMALPSSDRRKARVHADPKLMAREKLRNAVRTARTAIIKSEQLIAKAREELADPALSLFSYEAREAIRKHEQRVAVKADELRRAEINLELFDALHQEPTNEP